ncbi:MAG: hypothetical protein RR846_05330 [Oscillospiraceae bacterium]
MIAQVLISAFIISFFMFIAFYMGFEVAREVYTIKEIDIPQKAVKLVKKAFEKEAETEERRAERIFMENIENFGTNVPQREV